MPCLKVDAPITVRKHFPETIPRCCRTFKFKNLQTQLIQALRYTGQRKLMLLDMHHQITTSVKREEVAVSHDIFYGMPVGKAHDGMAAVSNPFWGWQKIQRPSEFPCGPDGTARLLTVESDLHQAIGFQQVDQYLPSRHWIVEMMEYPTTLDHGKSQIQIAELEDVGLPVCNVGNPEPLRHPCGVAQTRQAQIDSQDIAIGISPGNLNGMVAGAAAGDEYRYRAWTEADGLTWTESARELFYRIGVGTWHRDPPRIRIFLILRVHRQGNFVVN